MIHIKPLKEKRPFVQQPCNQATADPSSLKERLYRFIRPTDAPRVHGEHHIKAVSAHPSYSTLVILTTTNQLQVVKDTKIDVFDTPTDVHAVAVSPIHPLELARSDGTTLLLHKRKLPLPSDVLAYSPDALHIFSSNTLSSLLHTLSVTNTQTFETQVFSFSFSKPIDIQHSGDYIGVLYANNKFSVFSAEDYSVTLSVNNVHTFCWMGDVALMCGPFINGMRSFHPPLKKFLNDVGLPECTKVDKIMYQEGLIIVWHMQESFLYRVSWCPCLGVELMKKMEGKVCMVVESKQKRSGMGGWFIYSQIDASTIQTKEI